MKKILITGSGGTPSTNFVRSLRQSPENFYLIGIDSNKYYLQRSETDERYLGPQADHPRYIDFLQDVIHDTAPELLYMQPDQEILVVSEHRNLLPVRTFLPDHATIKTCQDKFASFQKWRDSGLTVPNTIVINNEDDLHQAFQLFGSPIWIRAIISPGGGKGSFRAPDAAIAKAWIDFCAGWGNFVAAECLQEHTITWQSIWKDGELIVAQGRKRLYWEFGNRAPSGVTGLTGTGMTVSDPRVDELAQKAIHAIDPQPHGIFSVDFTYDRHGVPNPTEINIGRFFTTHFFFTSAGLNMPYIYVKLAYGEHPPMLDRRINPLPDGKLWIRGLDFLPILSDMNSVEQDEAAFIRRMKSLHRSKKP